MAASNHRFTILCVIVSVLILAALGWRFFPQPVEPVRNNARIDLEPAVVSTRVHDDDKAVASMPPVSEEAAEPEEPPADDGVVESAPRTPRKERKAPTRTVRGVVTDRNGWPISNAVVNAYQPDKTPVATTDGWGRFEITGLPANPDKKLLSVEHPDYMQETVAKGAVAEPDEVLEITLRRGASLTGTVRFNGQPVADQEVKVGSSAFVLFGSRSQGRTRTDARGTYTLTTLEPEKSKVTAHLRTGDDGKTLRRMSIEVVLEDEQTSIADFDFLDLDASLEGQLLFNDYPVPNQSIDIVSRTLSHTEETFSATTNAKGFYRFEALPSGVLEVRAENMQVGTTSHARVTTIEIPAGFVSARDFLFGGTGVVAGYCTGLDGYDNTEIVLLTAEFFDMLVATALIRLLMNPDIETLLVAHPELADEGSFRIEDLEAGTYTLLAFGGDGFFGFEHIEYAFRHVTVSESEETHVVLGPNFISEDASEEDED